MVTPQPQRPSEWWSHLQLFWSGFLREPAKVSGRPVRL